jgi:hypothetical protein
VEESERWPQSLRHLIEDAVERGFVDGQWLHAAGMWLAFEDRDATDQTKAVLAELATLRRDAARYQWLRDGNAYAPKEAMVHGGEELDELCDEGIARARRSAER